MSDSFYVGIDIIGNLLSSNITLTGKFESQPDYFFNLIKDGKIIHRSGWTRKNTYSVELKENGEYLIQGHIRYGEKNIWEKSKTLFYRIKKKNQYTQKDFKVLLEEKESKLFCEIVGKPLRNPKYCFYLIRYGTIIEKTIWQESSCFSWNIQTIESGTYVVQGFVKDDDLRINSFSNPIFTMNNKFENDMERYFSELLISDFEMPNIPESHYPFSKFLIHVTEKTNIKSELLFSPPAFHYTKVSEENDMNNFHILHDSPINYSNNKSFIFSGTAKLGNNFIFGTDDVDNIDPHDLVDAIGNHSLVIINENGTIEIHNDLFGIQHHYYFKDNNEIIITNNLFLLMDYASSNKIKMEIDWKKLASEFCFIHVQPFHQNFSSSMSIHGLKQQKSDEFIQISDNITFNKTKLNDLVIEAHSFERNDYNEYIKSAAEEIIENIKVVYGHYRFNEIMLDLSGGLDSRTVFAAITNIPDVMNKITLNCRHSEIVPNDLIVASELNVRYNYPWNNSFRTNCWHPPSSIYAYQFGVYYSHRKSVGFRKYPKNHIRLNGMYGEVTARPYYPRKMIREQEFYEDVPEFIDGYFKKISQYCLLSSGTFGFDSIKDFFGKELEGNPGRSPLEKFDLHYLFFRAGLHCSETWRNYIKGAEWGPLQSEKLFVAKYGTFGDNTLPKLQIDLIKYLNASLLEIPFGSEQDNLDFSTIEKTKLKSVDLIRESTSNRDVLDRWETNEKEKKSNNEWIEYELSNWKSEADLPLLYNPKYNEKTGKEIMYDEKEMLGYLYNNSGAVFRKTVIIPLMTYINSKELDIKDIQLTNKLITACAFVKFLKC